MRGEKEGKSDAASGPSWRKGEFPAISLSVTAAQRGARHQRRVKVIAAGCTSPILALRAANKPFRLFDTRNSVFLAIVLAPGGKKKKNFAVGISDDWLKINVASPFFLSLFSLFSFLSKEKEETVKEFRPLVRFSPGFCSSVG